MTSIYFCLQEQEIDGETLVSLGTCATMEQLSACGLKGIKQQLKLKRLVASSQGAQGSQGAGTSHHTYTDHDSERPRKLTRKELKLLPPEEKTVYLMM